VLFRSVKLITGPGTPHDYSTMSFLLLTSSLTRRFAQVHLGKSSSIKPAILPTISQFNMDQIRSFARQAPPKGARNKKQGAKSSRKSVVKESFNEQHKEWVNFQRTLKVDGFETGQTLHVTDTAMSGNKSRGGKSVRKKMEKLLAPERARVEREKIMEQSGGGVFPPLRYSNDETARLLEEAYANIPKRTGKRGTRHLKRMKNRQFIVRRARAILKFQKKRAHFRVMNKRSQVLADIFQVKEDAPEIVKQEKSYQQMVLERWAEAVLGSKGTKSAKT